MYKRPDVSGPKLSTYDKVSLNSDIVESIGSILTQSNGILGVVKKTRLLFIAGQTRIHIDEVDGLGNFIELEVCKFTYFIISIKINLEYEMVHQ